MKSLRRFSAVAALILAFTLPSLAGEMDTGVGIAPPSPPASTQNGDMSTGSGVTTEGELFPEVVWGLVEGVLALL